MNILLLEDDISLNKAIKKVLELDYHIVDSFIDGQQLINTLDQIYDLYILDINVPHVSGLELLDLLLAQNDQAKVIIISSNTDVKSIQTAYTLGCVDYLKKPFHITELRAKISRFQSTQKKHLISYIKFKNEDEFLAKKERRFLTLLLDNLNFVVTYEMIESYVYENKNMTMDALRSLVRRLRNKLVDDIINNVVDEGYIISKSDDFSKQSQKIDTKEKIALLEKENTLLKLEKSVLIEKSTTDPLTGLYNRAKIKEMFLYEQQQFIRYGDTLSVILMDLDDFKSVNDIYGHNVGDEYLKNLAQTLTNFFRAVDVVGRWGGEEFFILLPKTSLDQVKEIALRLKDTISALECPKIGSRTASFGIARLEKEDTLDSVVQRADTALYLAKERGKNRVEIAEKI